MERLSQERVLQTLLGLGFSKTEAEVYLILSRKGPQKAIELGKALKLTKQQLYPCLKNLQGKAVVSVSLEHPARFSAVPFEKVLDLFIKAKMEEAQRIQQSKDKILSDWQSIALGETDDTSPKFMVLEGRNAIYSRIKHTYHREYVVRFLWLT